MMPLPVAQSNYSHSPCPVCKQVEQFGLFNSLFFIPEMSSDSHFQQYTLEHPTNHFKVQAAMSPGQQVDNAWPCIMYDVCVSKQQQQEKRQGPGEGGGERRERGRRERERGRGGEGAS